MTNPQTGENDQPHLSDLKGLSQSLASLTTSIRPILDLFPAALATLGASEIASLHSMQATVHGLISWRESTELAFESKIAELESKVKADGENLAELHTLKASLEEDNNQLRREKDTAVKRVSELELELGVQRSKWTEWEKTLSDLTVWKKAMETREKEAEVAIAGEQGLQGATPLIEAGHQERYAAETQKRKELDEDDRLGLGAVTPTSHESPLPPLHNAPPQHPPDANKRPRANDAEDVWTNRPPPPSPPSQRFHRMTLNPMTMTETVLDPVEPIEPIGPPTEPTNPPATQPAATEPATQPLAPAQPAKPPPLQKATRAKFTRAFFTSNGRNHDELMATANTSWNLNDISAASLKKFMERPPSVLWEQLAWWNAALDFYARRKMDLSDEASKEFRSRTSRLWQNICRRVEKNKMVIQTEPPFSF